MSAPQTAWAQPLAKELVDVFREDRFWLLKNQLSTSTYDVTTGTVRRQEPTIWHCGGAVVVKRTGPRAEFSKDGFVVQATDVEIWLDATTMPVEPMTNDLAWYQGALWSVYEVDPMYESGSELYGYKVLISNGGNVFTKGLGDVPPPEGAYPRLVNGGIWREIESLHWAQVPVPPVGAIGVPTWQLQPSIAGPVSALQPATVTTGLVNGGITVPVTYAVQWEVGDTDTGPFTPIVGATALTYTPTAAEVGKFLQVRVTATDSSTPALVTTTESNSIQVGTIPLTRATLPVIDAGTPPKYEEGSNLVGTPGTAAGGVGVITYTNEWQASADGKTNWRPLVANAGGDLDVTAAEIGQHIRYVTTATDQTPGAPQTITIESLVSPSIAAHLAKNLVVGTLPVFDGPMIDGGALAVTVDAVATSGQPPISYVYHWQWAPSNLGPWTDIAGAVGKNYTIGAGHDGQWLRVLAIATDSETIPGPSVLQLPSAARGPVVPTLSIKDATKLPTAAPQEGVNFVGIAGTFSGGLAPVAITYRWESAATAAGPWTPITGATGLTYTPVTADVNTVLRLVTIGTDSGGASLDNPSAPSLAVGAAIRSCVSGPVQIKGTWYCETGTWSYETAHYDPTYGVVQAWVQQTGGTKVIVDAVASAVPAGTPGNSKVQDPTRSLVYSTPLGAPTDWVQRPAGVWHNIRTGQWIEVFGNINPGADGYIIAPSPAEALSVLHAPTPAPGTWVETPSTTGGPSTWTETTTGQVVHQYASPSVIGLAGNTTLVWLGPAPDPWSETSPGVWDCGATGQVWTRAGKLDARPQPADTATIPRPINTRPKTNGTANPGYDPWVQLPRVSPVSWWNYVTRQELHQVAHPPIEIWESRPGSVEWYRQTDGFMLRQSRRPDVPADTATDWWEAQPGLWVSLLRGETYAQTGNPGLVGNEVAPGVPTPLYSPGDWTETSPGVWRSDVHLETVLQTGNPGITGLYGTRIRDLRLLAPPAITGNITVGLTATGHAGTASLGTPPYTTANQWQRRLGTGAWTDIAGATALTYTPVAGDVGYELRLESIITDSSPTPQTITLQSHATTPVAAAAAPLVAGVVPDPAGSLHSGNDITYQVGTSNGGVAPISHSAVLEISPDGVTGWTQLAGPITTGVATHTLVAGDAGKYLRVVDTITDSAPTPATVIDTSNVVGPIIAPLALAVDPTLAGGINVGDVLTLTPGSVTGGVAPITGPQIAWFQLPETAAGSGIPDESKRVLIAGAAGSTTYTIDGVDGGHFIQARVVWSDSATPTVGRVVKFTTPTAKIAIPPSYTLVKGLAFGSTDLWRRLLTYDASYSNKVGHIKVEWQNRTTGQKLEQPFTPRTAVPAASVVWNVHKDATSTFICGYLPSGQYRQSGTPYKVTAPVPGGLAEIYGWRGGTLATEILQNVDPSSAC